MSDQNTASGAVDTQATQDITPAATPGNTQSKAETVDIDAITAKAAEQAERKMEAVFKSMLQQQGLDTDTINRMTTEWKAKQRTPEQIAKEKDDEIARLSGELRQTKNERIAAGKGVPDEMIADYVRLAEGYEGKDFSEKLDKALAKFPLKKDAAPPPYATGTGADTMLGQNDDEFTKRINKYRRTQ